LIVSECQCGKKAFPPKEICVNCGSRSNLTHVPIDNLNQPAILVGFSKRLENGNNIIPAIVEMDNIMFPTRITDSDGQDLEIGMEMEMTFRRLRKTPEGLIEYGTIFRPLRTRRPGTRILEENDVGSKGIIGYGVALPYYGLRSVDIDIEKGLSQGQYEKISGFRERSVNNFDQDALTMAVDASRMALNMAGADGNEVDSIHFGTVNKPYRMKSSAITIAEAIGATPHVKAFDIESSSRGATSSFPDAVSLVGDTLLGIDKTLVVGSDIQCVREGDQLENGASSGAAAFLFGSENVVARIEGFESFTSDIPDQWWRMNDEFPETSGRFEGEPAYFRHMVNAARFLLIKLDRSIEEVDHVIVHYPTLGFAKKVSKILGRPMDDFGFKKVISMIGNPMASSTLISLSHTLDVAGPDESILMVHYGSGGGADAMLLHTTGELSDARKYQVSVTDQLKKREFVSYHTYRKRN
jgi:hydroxymethylglutaryl-CoA synthase